MNDYISKKSPNEFSCNSQGRDPSYREGPLAELRSNSVPSLFSNISIENVINSTQHRKSANALSWNVKYFSERFGVQNIGFLTLTFKDHVLCVKEAQKRLNSLLSNVIKPRYTDYVGVMERQKSGRIHYHLLVNVGKDIRTNFDFEAIKKRDYTSASKDLKSEWSFWRKTSPKFRFGRTELLPVKTSSEAIGRYVGKYIGKHIENRFEGDKNARLVRYSRGARVCSTRFMFLSEGSAEWRAKVCAFAHFVSSRTGCEPTMEGLSKQLGPRWAHSHRDFISNFPVLEA